jgi:hypothetical protein
VFSIHINNNHDTTQRMLRRTPNLLLYSSTILARCAICANSVAISEKEPATTSVPVLSTQNVTRPINELTHQTQTTYLQGVERMLISEKQHHANYCVLHFIGCKMRIVASEFKRLYAKEYVENASTNNNGDTVMKKAIVVRRLPDAPHKWSFTTLAVFKKLMTTKYYVAARSDEEWKKLGLAVAKLAQFYYLDFTKHFPPHEIERALTEVKIPKDIKQVIVSIVVGSAPN